MKSRLKIAVVLIGLGGQSLVSACGKLKNEKADDQSASEPGATTGTETETATASGTQKSVTTQFPWAELERCGGGLIDVLKSEPGKPLGTHKLASRPFEVEAKIGTSTIKANFKIAMDIVIYVDRYDVETVVDVHEPSEEMNTVLFAAKAAGLAVPPWTISTRSTLPSFEEIGVVNEKLGWERAPCSMIPARSRSVEAQGVTTHTVYDPGLPEILSPTATLAELREEIGAAREFPAVDSKDWKGANEAAAVAGSVVIKVSEVQPTEEEIKALGLTVPGESLTAFAVERVAKGENSLPRSIVVFDAKSGERLGSVFQFSDPILVKPGVVGLPPLQ